MWSLIQHTDYLPHTIHLVHEAKITSVKGSGASLSNFGKVCISTTMLWRAWETWEYTLGHIEPLGLALKLFMLPNV